MEGKYMHNVLFLSLEATNTEGVNDDHVSIDTRAGSAPWMRLRIIQVQSIADSHWLIFLVVSKYD